MKKQEPKNRERKRTPDNRTTTGFRISMVERAHSWLNRFRRLLVGWDKKPENYIAMLQIACGLIAFRAAGVFG
jgi:hypothetical protein